MGDGFAGALVRQVRGANEMTNIIMVKILGAPLVILALKEIGWWL